MRFALNTHYVWILIGAIAASLELLPHTASAQSPLNTFPEIADYLDSHKQTSLEQFLGLLSPDIRSRFQFVYHSRSPNPSSLAFPRVVLWNEDASLMMGFSSNPEGKNANIVEFIESDPKTGKYNFRKLQFSESGVVVDRHPRTCTGCHGVPESKMDTIPMRPLWDRYPDWPGVLGSAHNDWVTKRGHYGISLTPNWEFEENSLKLLKKNPSSRLRHLKGLSEITIRKLSSSSLVLTEAMTRNHFQNIISIVNERVTTFYESGQYPRIRKEVMDFVDSKIHPARFSEVNIPELFSGWEKTAAEHSSTKIERVRSLVLEYGTRRDQLTLQKASIDVLPHSMSTGNHTLGFILLMLGIEPGSLNSTLEPFTFYLDTALPGIRSTKYSYNFIETIRNIFQSPTQPTRLYESECGSLLLPTTREDPDKAVDFLYKTMTDTK